MALPRITRTFVDGPFGQLHCRVSKPETPSKSPIICLHMSPKSGKTFQDILPHLATDRIVLAPDYPGHGESDPPPPQPHVSIADFAASVWAAGDKLAKGPVHVLGYHTGSMVAVEMAIQRVASVKSIVSISAPVFTEEEMAELNNDYSPIPIDEAGTRFRVMWERVLHHRGPGMTLQMAAASFAENLRAGDDYEWGHRAAFAYAPSYNRNLEHIHQPVLVMNPDDDCHEQTIRADNMFANSQRLELPQWGHGFLNAFAAEAARVILDFLEDTERQ